MYPVSRRCPITDLPKLPEEQNDLTVKGKIAKPKRQLKQQTPNSLTQITKQAASKIMYPKAKT